MSIMMQYYDAAFDAIYQLSSITPNIIQSPFKALASPYWFENCHHFPSKAFD